MRLRSISSVLLVLTLACGDDGGGGGTTGSTGPGSTGPGSTGPGSTATTEGTDSGSSTAVATGDTTVATSDTTGQVTEGESTGTTGRFTTDGSTTGGSTTGGMASLDAAMASLEISQDCMPVVPPDPVNASFVLSLDNTGDVAASASVTSAVFLDAGGMQVATLDVVPDAFGPIAAGDSAMTMVSKVAGSLVPSNGCNVLQCGQSHTLELRLDVDGTEVIASDVAVVGCVF